MTGDARWDKPPRHAPWPDIRNEKQTRDTRTQSDRRRRSRGQGPRHYKVTDHAYAPYTPGQVYIFYATLAGAGAESFAVLAGETAPIITGGWPKVNVISRPRRLGYTVAAGYDPITMDVPVQFERVVRNPPINGHVQFSITRSIERDVERLEWMAGRGKLYRHHHGRAAEGDPPLVSVASYDGGGQVVNLIPPNARGILYTITNIAYDGSSAGAIRDTAGDLTRQKAMITLQQWSAAPGDTNNSPGARQRARGAAKGYKVYRTNHAQYSVLIIAEHHARRHDARALKEILALTRKHGHGHGIRSYTQHLKPGTPIYIPNSLRI